MIYSTWSYWGSIKELFFGIEEPTVDPRITQILTSINTVKEFQDLSIQNQNNNIKITYRLLPDVECANLNIDTAAVSFRNSLLGGEETEVLIKESIPEERKYRSIIAETCNASLRNEFLGLDQAAKAGHLNKDRYVFEKERIEWKAYQKAVNIAKEVENSNRFSKPLYSENEKRAAETFEDYYRMSEKSYHVDKYKRLYSELTGNKKA